MTKPSMVYDDVGKWSSYFRLNNSMLLACPRFCFEGLIRAHAADRPDVVLGCLLGPVSTGMGQPFGSHLNISDYIYS